MAASLLPHVHLGTRHHPILMLIATLDSRIKDPCHIHHSIPVIPQRSTRFGRHLCTTLTVPSINTCITPTALLMRAPCTPHLHDNTLQTCITGMCRELLVYLAALQSASVTVLGPYVGLARSEVSRMATRETMVDVSMLLVSVAVLALRA